MAYDPATPAGQVRLLLNDTATASEDQVFTDAEITAFLTMEGDVVKLAAAQAIETNASNEALASKVLRTETATTDGAKLADALRKHAQSLRDQVAAVVDDEGYAFEVVDFPTGYPYAELTESPAYGF